MTEQHFRFDSEDQRMFAYIAGLAYAYPGRFVGTFAGSGADEASVRKAAERIAHDNKLDVTDCVKFMVTCSPYDFRGHNLNMLMDSAYIWSDMDNALGLPYQTFASIGIGIDRDEAHMPDSKPED